MSARSVGQNTPVRLTAALGEEYSRLFRTCVIGARHSLALERRIVRLLQTRARYEVVAAGTNVPWPFVAAVHVLESGQDFRTHLHNGDPLRERTVRVPAGRPRGTPPFAWEDSAVDALRLQSLHRVRDWSLPSMLYRLEKYNGFGYRLHHPEVKSPYLWGGSNHYTRGKFVRDGVWDANAVSTQLGAAVLLRRLAELGHFDAVQLLAPSSGLPLVVPFHRSRPRDRATREMALALQRWLNTHDGVFVREDGWPGPRTAAAYRKVTGHFLPGDPRDSAHAGLAEKGESRASTFSANPLRQSFECDFEGPPR